VPFATRALRDIRELCGSKAVLKENIYRSVYNLERPRLLATTPLRLHLAHVLNLLPMRESQ
jgi:hypothetical protein